MSFPNWNLPLIFQGLFFHAVFAENVVSVIHIVSPE